MNKGTVFQRILQMMLKVRRAMLVNFWVHLEVAKREEKSWDSCFLEEVNDSFSSWLSPDESILYLLIRCP